ncbi:RNase H family protein [Reinekea sp.]|jgi:ribonuclease HI|uniref:RNase H family protein n=1 Tax=Reinekea sp. TaxID=1970455 RepID=UPI002A822A66|nr:RNase H family protein [Reinekea sp.]
MNVWQTANKQPVKINHLWQELDELMGRYRVFWHWVKGHSGAPMNKLADLLAARVMDKLVKS